MPRPRLPLRRCEPHAERDEDSARDALDRAANSRPAQEVSRLRDCERVARQPNERHRAEEEAEEEQGTERRLAAGCELRQEAREKRRHLRVAEIADHTL